jgi:hypothetical protein
VYTCDARRRELDSGRCDYSILVGANRILVGAKATLVNAMVMLVGAVVLLVSAK